MTALASWIHYTDQPAQLESQPQFSLSDIFNSSGRCRGKHTPTSCDSAHISNINNGRQRNLQSIFNHGGIILVWYNLVRFIKNLTGQTDNQRRSRSLSVVVNDLHELGNIELRYYNINFIIIMFLIICDHDSSFIQQLLNILVYKRTCMQIHGANSTSSAIVFMINDVKLACILTKDSLINLTSKIAKFSGQPCTMFSEAPPC